MFSMVGRRVPVVATDKVGIWFEIDFLSFLPPAVGYMFSAVDKGVPAVWRLKVGKRFQMTDFRHQIGSDSVSWRFSSQQVGIQDC